MAHSNRSIPVWLVGIVAIALVVVGWIEWNSRRHEAPPVETPVPEEKAPVAAAPAAKPVGNVVQQSTQVAAVDLAAKAADDEAREAEWAKMREKSIEVQKKLRAEQQAQKTQALDANERCMDGVKFKRAGNGWVQTGNC